MPIPYVKFNDAKHEYTHSVTNKRYISCTTLIGSYADKFDGEYWSLYKGLQDYLGISDADKKIFSKMMMDYGVRWDNNDISLLYAICKMLKADMTIVKQNARRRLIAWDDKKEQSSKIGTHIHQKEEKKAYTSNVMTFKTGDVRTNKQYSFDLTQLLDGGYSELLLYLHEFEVAGQADKVKIETCEVKNEIIRYVDIDDWKTNEVIDKDNQFKRFKKPIGHIFDNKYWKYALQISMYAYMLERYGYVVRHLQFTHIDRVPGTTQELNRTPYEVPYLRSECISILKDYQQKYAA